MFWHCSLCPEDIKLSIGFSYTVLLLFKWSNLGIKTESLNHVLHSFSLSTMMKHTTVYSTQEFYHGSTTEPKEGRFQTSLLGRFCRV